MNPRVLIATTNEGKLREILPILEGLAIDFCTLRDWPGLVEPEESGATFAENARQKATHYATLTALPTIAEDSGLEIDALDGAPGVRSARYNGDSYSQKFDAIYRALEARGSDQSEARFVAAICLVGHGRILFETTGTIEGVVAAAPRGEGGFGYDPIFYYPPLGRTLAELPLNVKATVSHRGIAFRKLRAFLEQEPVIR
jgi:XTP/dITP diphosphohydrolase